MKTSSQKHADLKELSRKIKVNIFEMLKLTDELLRDPEYVDQFGGEAQLIDTLETSEFSHFGGQPSLASMLRAYRANPKRATWQEYHFNLRVMIDLATPAKEKAAEPHINWKKKCGELELQVEQLESSLNESRRLCESLTKEVERLKIESAEMRGRLKYIEGRSLVRS